MTIMQMLLAGGASPPIEYIDLATAGTSGSETSLLVSVPGGRQPSDLLLLLAAGHDNSRTLSASSGWTLETQSEGSGVQSRESDGTESSVTQTWSGDTRAAAACIVVRNAALAASGAMYGGSNDTVIGGHTFSADGYSFALLLNRNTNEEEVTPSGWTSLATGFGGNRFYRVVYRVQPAGTVYAPQLLTLDNGAAIAWAQVEAG